MDAGSVDISGNPRGQAPLTAASAHLLPKVFITMASETQGIDAKRRGGVETTCAMRAPAGRRRPRSIPPEAGEYARDKAADCGVADGSTALGTIQAAVATPAADWAPSTSPTGR